MQELKLASLKFVSQADVVVGESTAEPKIWLIIVFALIVGFDHPVDFD